MHELQAISLPPVHVLSIRSNADLQCNCVLPNVSGIGWSDGGRCKGLWLTVALLQDSWLCLCHLAVCETVGPTQGTLANGTMCKWCWAELMQFVVESELPRSSYVIPTRQLVFPPPPLQLTDTSHLQRPSQQNPRSVLAEMYLEMSAICLANDRVPETPV